MAQRELVPSHAVLDDPAHRGWHIGFPTTNEQLEGPDLRERAHRLGRALLDRGVRPGDIVGLHVHTSPAVPIGVFGIWSAGAAVATLPPRAPLERFVAAARMTHVVSDAPLELAGVTVLDPAQLAREGGSSPLPPVEPEDLAVVQFTSGSTRRPKGVMLTHRAISVGINAIVVSSELSPDDVFAQWVPHFHDMGFFAYLANLFAGGSSYLLPPTAFVLRPANFLRFFADVGGTVMTCPNFGVRRMLEAVDDPASLDLSRWRLLYNGAEPIAADAIDQFAVKFAPSGVLPSTMCPVYGLAEATLAATIPLPGSIPRIVHLRRSALANDGTIEPAVEGDTKALVGVGRPVAGLDLRITGEPGQRGEIQLRGAAVMSGYLHEPEATRDAFDGDWLRTGDLGFQLDGDLFVAGRSKDMVIVSGQNYYPEDVEEVARQVPGVYRGRCVAFSDAEQEKVVVLVEPDRKAGDELATQIRAQVSGGLGLSAVEVRLVPRRWLPQTTSGKWQRSLAREQLGGVR